MDPLFESFVNSLHPTFQRLLTMQPVKYDTLPKGMTASGVYLFSENGRHLYVGRSRNIKSRLGRHCRPGATHRMAAFAFRLAREQTGKLNATYKKKGSRSALIQEPEFHDAFNAAKARIRVMDIRYVEESDPIRQTLLEIYTAMVLQTPYNDFDTH
jgi:predicted GIY-YIG superfamily endonuclease